MFKNNALPFALVFFVCLFAGVSLFSGGRGDSSASRDGSSTRNRDSRSTFSGGSTDMPDVTGVTEVEFSVPCTLMLSQGDDESLTVNPGIRSDEIEVTVVGNKLRIKLRDSWMNLSNRDYVFTLQLKNLSSLSASAASRVEASSVTSDSFYLSASGASTVEFSSITAQSADFQLSGSSNFRVDTCDASRLSLGCSGACNMFINQCASDYIDVDVSGSSSVTLDGNGPVEKIQLELSGASGFDSEYLPALEVTAGISGGSEAVVAVSGKLVANVSGAGGLQYLGSPTVDSETSGGGTVRRK